MCLAFQGLIECEGLLSDLSRGGAAGLASGSLTSSNSSSSSSNNNNSTSNNNFGPPPSALQGGNYLRTAQAQYMPHQYQQQQQQQQYPHDYNRPPTPPSPSERSNSPLNNHRGEQFQSNRALKELVRVRYIAQGSACTRQG